MFFSFFIIKPLIVLRCYFLSPFALFFKKKNNAKRILLEFFKKLYNCVDDEEKKEKKLEKTLKRNCKQISLVRLIFSIIITIKIDEQKSDE